MEFWGIRHEKSDLPGGRLPQSGTNNIAVPFLMSRRESMPFFSG